ncbi:MAG: hypothetical protein ACYSSO_07380 [Planctomycetota bacterium]|jgi:hypothetical protein
MKALNGKKCKGCGWEYTNNQIISLHGRVGLRKGDHVRVACLGCFKEIKLLFDGDTPG